MTPSVALREAALQRPGVGADLQGARSFTSADVDRACDRESRAPFGASRCAAGRTPGSGTIRL